MFSDKKRVGALLWHSRIEPELAEGKLLSDQLEEHPSWALC